MDRVSNLEALGILFIAFVIYVFIPLALSFLAVWMLIKILRIQDKNKKALHQKRGNMTELRCLGCGAVIDSNQQSCQACGWTWK
jgi:hypothetical protein